MASGRNALESGPFGGWLSLLAALGPTTDIAQAALGSNFDPLRFQGATAILAGMSPLQTSVQIAVLERKSLPLPNEKRPMSAFGVSFARPGLLLLLADPEQFTSVGTDQRLLQPDRRAVLGIIKAGAVDVLAAHKEHVRSVFTHIEKVMINDKLVAIHEA